MLTLLLSVISALIILYTLGLYTYAYFKGGRNKLIKHFVLILTVCLFYSIFIIGLRQVYLWSLDPILFTLIALYSIIIFINFIKQSFKGNL